jgi:hypothetical protein
MIEGQRLRDNGIGWNAMWTAIGRRRKVGDKGPTLALGRKRLTKVLQYWIGVSVISDNGFSPALTP